MRIVNFILAIMFLLFAFVQINDPDPVIWILIYGAVLNFKPSIIGAIITWALSVFTTACRAIVHSHSSKLLHDFEMS